MDIATAQAIAKKEGFDSMTFELVGPEGRLQGRWIDAHLGFLDLTMPTGEAKTFLVSQFLTVPGLQIENLRGKDDRRNELEVNEAIQEIFQEPVSMARHSAAPLEVSNGSDAAEAEAEDAEAS